MLHFSTFLQAQLKKYVLEGVVTHLGESVGQEVAREYKKLVEAKLASVKARAPATSPAVTTRQTSSFHLSVDIISSVVQQHVNTKFKVTKLLN